jgi:hypothetical protein
VRDPEARLRAGTTTAIIAGESLVVGGDIILSAVGIEVSGANMAKIRDAMNRLQSGEPLKATVLRAGLVLELNGRAP